MGLFQTVTTKLWANKGLKFLYALELGFHFTRTKGLNPVPMCTKWGPLWYVFPRLTWKTLSGQSPDFNYIEHLCDELECKLCTRPFSSLPSRAQALGGQLHINASSFKKVTNGYDGQVSTYIGNIVQFLALTLWTCPNHTGVRFFSLLVLF